MNEYSHFSARASLTGVGEWMRGQRIWETVAERVQIQQKTLRYRPLDKVLDALITILAGGGGLVEINTRVRPDRVLQAAFGRSGCAEQSTVSQTLNACSAETVLQMRSALDELYRAHSQGYGHDYSRQWQVLDVDMTGLPTDRLGEGVDRGYFGPNRCHRGRQLGRVSATRYDEIVVERLYPGRRQLHHSLRELIRAAEQTLDLHRTRRQRTLIRLDSGGGEDAHVNWLLRRGYGLLVKAHSTQRAKKLARQVEVWLTDPKDPHRQMAWLPCPHRYARPTRQALVRMPKHTGQWAYALLVCSAPDDLLAELGHYPIRPTPTETEQLLALVYAYDRRGGGIETQFKADKRGLAMARRHKRAFPAQEILLLLALLAHNVLVWLRQRLALTQPPLAHLGILRLVRDLFSMAGKANLDAQGYLIHVILNRRAPLAHALVQAFPAACPNTGLSFSLGEI